MGNAIARAATRIPRSTGTPAEATGSAVHAQTPVSVQQDAVNALALKQWRREEQANTHAASLEDMI
jgi:hypothetical protein